MIEHQMFSTMDLLNVISEYGCHRLTQFREIVFFLPHKDLGHEADDLSLTIWSLISTSSIRCRRKRRIQSWLWLMKLHTSRIASWWWFVELMNDSCPLRNFVKGRFGIKSDDILTDVLNGFLVGNVIETSVHFNPSVHDISVASSLLTSKILGRQSFSARMRRRTWRDARTKQKLTSWTMITWY